MKIRTQQRIPGIRRVPASTSLLPIIEARIAEDAKRFGVSKSFVRATALADGLGIDVERYYEPREKRRNGKTR